MPPIFAAGFLGIEHFTPPWDVFFLPLFNLLMVLYQLPVIDFALAIILFTVIIRTLVAPLFVQQIRSQKEMQRMQPLIKEVQRKHKGNSQKVQEETMALYREHGVNPAAGCLPLVLQLPILFALYQALIRASNVVTLTADQVKSADFTALKAALPGITSAGTPTTFNAPISGPCNLPAFESGNFTHFLPLNCQLIDPIKLGGQVETTVSWLANPFNSLHTHLNLATTDQTFALVIGGFSLSLLAVIAAVLQFVQVKMTAPPRNADDPTSSATSSMTYLFPLLTIFWGGIFPSGLILYWVVYTAYLVVQQYFIMGWGNLFPILGWAPGFASGSGPPATRPRPRQTERDARPAPADPPPNPNPPAGQRPPQRPGAQRPAGRRRRGRRR